MFLSLKTYEYFYYQHKISQVDLAPPPLVVAWQQFFKERFPLVHTVCFSSFPRSQAEQETRQAEMGKCK